MTAMKSLMWSLDVNVSLLKNDKELIVVKQTPEGATFYQGYE